MQGLAHKGDIGQPQIQPHLANGIAEKHLGFWGNRLTGAAGGDCETFADQIIDDFLRPIWMARHQHGQDIGLMFCQHPVNFCHALLFTRMGAHGYPGRPVSNHGTNGRKGCRVDLG